MGSEIFSEKICGSEIFSEKDMEMRNICGKKYGPLIISRASSDRVSGVEKDQP